MQHLLTAQDVFNGRGWDDHALLRKAERELERLRSTHGMDATDHMFNFAVTLAAVCDWTFHLHLSNLPRWSGKKEKNFTHWLRVNCADAFVFIDIANEYKHANRATPSTLAEKMMLSFIDLGIHPEMRSQIDLNKGKIGSFFRQSSSTARPSTSTTQLSGQLLGGDPSHQRAPCRWMLKIMFSFERSATGALAMFAITINFFRQPIKNGVTAFWR